MRRRRRLLFAMMDHTRMITSMVFACPDCYESARSYQPGDSVHPGVLETVKRGEIGMNNELLVKCRSCSGQWKVTQVPQVKGGQFVFRETQK